MKIVVLKNAQKELKSAPKEFLQDIFSLFADLSLGKRILMPLSRPLPSIFKGLHELRLSGKSGEFRVFYIIKPGDGIYIIHASSKKTESITSMTSSLLKARIKSIKHE
jgi:phage-related protein